MKLFQLNFFGIVILLLVVLLLFVLPSYIIQNIWNSAYSHMIDRDLSIELWQAALLWGAIATLIYMSGIFSFKLSFKTLDSIDLESINDPELRDEIEKLKLQAQKAEEKKKPRK